jgi:hypothetical protein
VKLLGNHTPGTRNSRNGDEYEILRILQISRATIDEETREAVKDRLFEEWLERERQKATVEWFW